MSVIDQIKILDRKIMQNEVQYDIDICYMLYEVQYDIWIVF